MTAKDYVTVKGNFVMQSEHSHDCYLTDGILAIGGNFTQFKGGNAVDNFKAMGSHTTILSSVSSTQYVNFENFDSSCFNNLILTKDVENYSFNPEKCWKGTMEVIYPLVNNSTVSSNTVLTKQTVTIKGIAQGGKGAYTYKYYYEKGNGAWTEFPASRISDDGKTAKFSATSAGAYGIKVIVSDEKGYSEQKTFDITVQNPLVNESTVDKTLFYVGGKAVITGKASGGNGTYKYEFYYKRSNASSWTKFGSDTSATLKPSSAGEFDIRVYAKDTLNRTSVKNVKITVTQPLVNKATVSSEKINVGQTVTIKGDASGGKGSYTYEFYYKRANASSWTKFGSANSASLKPSSAGEFDVKVVVKDAAGNSEVKTFRVKAVNFKNDTTISSEKIKVGQSAVVTGKASGGSGTYKYEFYYKRSNASSWTKFGSDTSATLKPSSAGTFNIRVYAKDNEGNSAVKNFTVTAS